MKYLLAIASIILSNCSRIDNKSLSENNSNYSRLTKSYFDELNLKHFNNSLKHMSGSVRLLDILKNFELISSADWNEAGGILSSIDVGLGVQTAEFELGRSKKSHLILCGQYNSSESDAQNVMIDYIEFHDSNGHVYYSRRNNEKFSSLKPLILGK